MKIETFIEFVLLAIVLVLLGLIFTIVQEDPISQPNILRTTNDWYTVSSLTQTMTVRVAWNLYEDESEYVFFEAEPPFQLEYPFTIAGGMPLGSVYEIAKYCDCRLDNGLVFRWRKGSPPTLVGDSRWVIVKKEKEEKHAGEDQ